MSGPPSGKALWYWPPELKRSMSFHLALTRAGTTPFLDCAAHSRVGCIPLERPRQLQVERDHADEVRWTKQLPTCKETPPIRR